MADDEQVKCKFCPWTTPRFRKSDGKERQDITMRLRAHVNSKHKNEGRFKARDLDQELYNKERQIKLPDKETIAPKQRVVSKYCKED